MRWRGLEDQRLGRCAAWRDDVAGFLGTLVDDRLSPHRCGVDELGGLFLRGSGRVSAGHVIRGCGGGGGIRLCVLLLRRLDGDDFVGGVDGRPERHVLGRLRPASLPGHDAVEAEDDGLDDTVVERNAHGLRQLLAVEHGEGDGCGDADILVDALNGHGDTFRAVQSDARGDDVRNDQPQHARGRHADEELPVAIPDLHVRVAVGKHRREDDEQDSGCVAKSVGVQVEVVRVDVVGREQTQSDGADDDGEADEESVPVDAGDDIVIVGHAGVEEQVQRQSDDREQRGDCGHGHRKGQICVEHRAPPVRVGTTWTARDDEERDSHGLVELQRLHHQETQEGQDDELQ
mmetsp:Transcript_446/g.1243  ORF Transcript_446/g.1243 Transcript_446/m.1243 type:complete len:346 (+) Transcript_446:165-1202(+)